MVVKSLICKGRVTLRKGGLGRGALRDELAEE